MRESRQDLGWAALVTVVILGPLLLGGGYWLVGDMVFVPHQPWKGAWLGLDGSLPRAVPMDALVSALTQVVPGSVVQRVLLLGSFVVGGVGAGRLVAGHAWYARAAAITLLLWNPWVAEHLRMGQWAILAGYLLLPWVALAGIRLRDEPRSGLAPALVALTLSAICSPSSGAMAAFVLVVLALRRSWGSALALGGLALVGNLAWLVPSVLARTDRVSGSGVFEAFAARGESALGVWPSLLSLGGTWKTSVVPAERTSSVLVLLSCALTVAALLGVRRSRLAGDRRTLVGLVVVAVTCLVVAVLPALPGGSALLDAVGRHVPATALLRDSHRFLAPAVLLLLPGLAGAVTWLRGRVREQREAIWAVIALLVLAPVLLLPSLAWGAAGGLTRSTYPREWEQVARILDEQGPGRTVVLPWAGSYRGYAWNGYRAVLDPAPRFFPGDVLVDDRVIVGDLVVPAEDPLSAGVARALAATDSETALRELGVRWVLVEKGMAGGPVPEGRAVFDGAQLRLVDLAPVPSRGRPARAEWLVVAAAVASGLLLSAGIAVILRRGV